VAQLQQSATRSLPILPAFDQLQRADCDPLFAAAWKNAGQSLRAKIKDLVQLGIAADPAFFY
jgi:hypothetical protein